MFALGLHPHQLIEHRHPCLGDLVNDNAATTEGGYRGLSNDGGEEQNRHEEGKGGI